MTARPLALALLLAGCGAPEPGGASIYALAIDGAPGGALLSAWVAPGTAHHAWLAGGYVGVDPATVGDGRVGRLVRYDDGVLTTVCTADRVLWWVQGVRVGDEEVVFAAGEGGRVLRYRGGHCDMLATGDLWPEGAPTFFGLLARAVDDVTFVGGSTGDGPRGVLLHWDGATFARIDDRLPAAARTRTLYKIADGALGTFIVGEAGTLLQQGADARWTAIDLALPSGDDRLFTVACDRVAARCFAVGGSGQGVVLRGDASGWRAPPGFEDLPGVAGVSMQDGNSTFLVGAYGFTMHTNNVTTYRPLTPPTPAGLHAVGTNASLAIAVGGELDTATVAQRAVVLVRGEAGTHFTFDGRSYEASGTVRPTLGAGVGGSQ